MSGSSPHRHRITFSRYAEFRPHLIGLSGEDALSRAYAWDVRCFVDRTAVLPKALLNTPATLHIDSAVGPRTWHGIVSEVKQEEFTPRHRYFSLRIEPRVALLRLAARSQVYQEKSVIGVVQSLLAEHGFTETDSSLHLSETYAVQEYVVQHAESDWDFINRLLEDAGVTYFFEQAGEFERLVLCDHPAGFPSYHPDRLVSYHDGAATHLVDESISQLGLAATVGPRRSAQRDYNYRHSTLDVHGHADTGLAGGGVYDEYGAQVRSPEEARRLAMIRSQEFRVGHRQYRGTSTCRGLAAGQRVTVAGHFRADFNRELLITTVRHELSAPREAAQEPNPAVPLEYSNTFEAREAELPYRAPRRTAMPRIEGVAHAVVDGATDGPYAQIDEQGRYKVRLAIDRPERAGGKASRFVRMAQPYAGADYGMHHPLHKKTEVLLAHIEGRPDRPLILASVPNPATGSPVAAPNATQSIVRTAGANVLELEDHAARKRIQVATPQAATAMTFGAPGLDGPAGANLKTDAHEQKSVDGNSVTTIGANRTEAVAGNRSDQVNGKASLNVRGSSETLAAQTDGWEVATDLVIKAGAEISLLCGASTLVMTSGGHITLHGSLIKVEGTANTAVLSLTTLVVAAYLSAGNGTILGESVLWHVGGLALASLSGDNTKLGASGDLALAGSAVKFN